MMSRGKTSIKLTLERDGFNGSDQPFAMKCEIDNKINESDVKKLKIKLM